MIATSSIQYLTLANSKRIAYYFDYHGAHLPTIIFLHDSLGCIQLWRDFPEKLAQQFPCNIFIYDRIGYGFSDPMDTYIRPTDYMTQEAILLEEIIEIKKLKNVVLFGHSDGGTIALLAASRQHHEIKNIICEAGHIFVEDITIQSILAAKVAYNNTTLPEKLKKYHGDKVPMLFKAWTDIWLDSKFRNWNIIYELKKIKTPLLFLQGSADEYGTDLQVMETIKHVSGPKEYHLLHNIYHTPHKEAPDVVVPIISHFLKNVIV